MEKSNSTNYYKREEVGCGLGFENFGTKNTVEHQEEIKGFILAQYYLVFLVVCVFSFVVELSQPTFVI